jgi:hypothetical protein
MTEALVKYEKTPTPASMMMTAIEKGLDLEKVEKAMKLQMEWEKNEAKKAYHLAMADFKKNPPEIEKDKEVSYGTTKYSHASLANVTCKINKALSEHGLSASWETAQSENGKITVTCRITHEMGHGEQTSLSAMPDTSGAKNSIQAIGSAISYLERYTVLALTGLATQDMDDDGKGAEPPAPITDKHLSQLRDMILDKEADEARFCEFLKIEKLEDLPETRFSEAFEAIKKKKKIEKKPEKKEPDDVQSMIAKKNAELGVK